MTRIDQILPDSGRNTWRTVKNLAKAVLRKEVDSPQLATTSGTSAASSTITIHASTDAPEWFLSALKMLQLGKMPLTACWLELLMVWKAFEEASKYKENGFLNSKG